MQTHTHTDIYTETIQSNQTHAGNNGLLHCDLKFRCIIGSRITYSMIKYQNNALFIMRLSCITKSHGNLIVHLMWSCCGYMLPSFILIVSYIAIRS